MKYNISSTMIYHDNVSCELECHFLFASEHRIRRMILTLTFHLMTERYHEHATSVVLKLLRNNTRNFILYRACSHLHYHASVSNVFSMMSLMKSNCCKSYKEISSRVFLSLHFHGALNEVLCYILSIKQLHKCHMGILLSFQLDAQHVDVCVYCYA